MVGNAKFGGEKKMVGEETYEVDMECCNCGHGMTVEILKGVWVGESEDICPNCECELGDCCVISE